MTPVNRILRAYENAGCGLDFNPCESAYALICKAEWKEIIQRFQNSLNFPNDAALQFAAFARREFQVGGVGIAFDNQAPDAYNIIFYLGGGGTKCEAFCPQTHRFIRVEDLPGGQDGMMLLW